MADTSLNLRSLVNSAGSGGGVVINSVGKSTPTPVGTQAKSPANNITPPPNTLSSSQANLKDLSQNYANVNGTIYNKQRGTAGGFSSWDQFLNDAGLPTGTSGTTLKFDTTWTPPSSTPATSNSTPIPTSTPVTSTSTTPPSSGAYIPTSGGTTGVNQGGIIGNLLGTANIDPNLDSNINKTQQDIKDLQTNEANDLAGLAGNGTDLGLATGQGAVVQNKYSGRINATQGLLASLLNERGQNIGATTSAGNLNAPITNPQTGGLVTPSSPTTTGQTTSGATNLSSLIGVGNGTNGHPKGEYFVNSAVGGMQANQGFSSPQQLADFVNQQQPGANATAQNVFQLLSSGALNNSGGNSALNPLTQVDTIAQQVISGQKSLDEAKSMGGTIPNWASVLNAALIKANGGQPIDEAAIKAKYDSNQQTQTTQANLKAQFIVAQQQSQALLGQLQPLLTKINPSNFTFANGVIQAAAGFVGDSNYQAAANLLTEIANRYAQVLGAGGSITDTVRDTATGMINGLASGQNISQVINHLDAQASAVINATHTPSTTGRNNTNNSATIPPGALTIK